MLTLADLLAEPSLRLRLHAGADLTGRPIRWAHATELADPTGFLEGGELLLTTGLALRDGFADYMARLAGVGVAALGFGTGLSHRSVPAELVAAAEAHRVPLVEVPRAVPFIAITKAVSTALAAEEYATVVRASAGQQELTRAAVGDGGVSALVRRLARLLHGWVLLTDGGAGVLAAAPPSAGARLNALRADVDRLRGRPGVSTFARSLDGQEVVLQVLGSGQRGVLAVGRESSLDAADQHIVNTAAALLTVALEQDAAQRGALRALRSGLLDLLLAGQHDLVETCLAELGTPLPIEPVTVAVLRAKPAALRAGYPLAEPEFAFLAERPDRLIGLLPASPSQPTLSGQSTNPDQTTNSTKPGDHRSAESIALGDRCPGDSDEPDDRHVNDPAGRGDRHSTMASEGGERRWDEGGEASAREKPGDRQDARDRHEARGREEAHDQQTARAWQEARDRQDARGRDEARDRHGTRDRQETGARQEARDREDARDREEARGRELERIGRLADRIGAYGGVSAPVALSELSVGVRQANQAADAAHRTGKTIGRFRELADQGIFGLLPGDEARAVATAVLAPLREADLAGRGDLVASLRAWLSVHGQWDPAAGLLGVHRHTLRNRIARIAALTGRDLDEPSVRAELWLALRLSENSTH